MRVKEAYMDYQQKEKSRSNAATSERECGATNGAESLPCNHEQYKPKSRNRQAQTISQFLMQGEENAISTAQLKALARCDTRSLRQKVSNERARGVPILTSGKGGYFLPSEGQKGLEEIKRNRAFLMAKGVGTLRTAHNVLLQAIEGQEQIKEAAEHGAAENVL